MLKKSIITCQVFGKVDWVADCGCEVGLYVRTSAREATRCVLRGPSIEAALANKQLSEGVMVTASGSLFARCFTQKRGNPVAELVCDVESLMLEPANGVRVRGAISVLLKGVIMHWSHDAACAKTFFNYPNSNTRPPKVVATVLLKSWISTMSAAKQARFLNAIRVGREFTLSGSCEANCYADKDGEMVPVMSLLPYNFNLQS